MAAKSHATLSGTRELRAALDVIVDDIHHGLAPAGRRATAIVLPVAKGLAPRRSGILADSLDATAVSIVSGEPYALPIHWGWPRRNIEGNAFIVDAARAVEDAWTAVYADHVQDLIDHGITSTGADSPRTTA